MLKRGKKGTNPEISDLVDFQGPDRRRFSELCGFAVFFFSKSRSSKPIFGHSAGSPQLDRPHCKQF